ncbi:MAG: hypothetical protein IPK19_24810 [Chloroflexi bacterium]|nr:hypothetical protein [Chloroflexota bacterium]
MSRLLTIVATALAIGTGLIVLIELVAQVLGIPTLGLTQNLLQIAVITVAMAILMGVLNLIGVHGQRLVQRRRGWYYSLALLAAFFIVIALWLSGQNESNRLLLDTVQVSIEASLGALVFFALVFGAYRLMRRRVTVSGMLFTVVVIIVLVGALPLASVAPVAAVRDWLLTVPASAGARGLLIGIALATVVTGVRVLTGQERSLRE